MNHTINSLGLQELFADIISETDNPITFSAYLAPSAQICPCCGKITSRIHGYKLQKIKDLPARLKNVIILLRKRRYICSCGKTFFQANSFLPKYYRATNRFYSGILRSMYSSRSFKDIAVDFNVSVNTVSKMSKMISIPTPQELPEVLGIDEFKGNINKEKYQCILTDIKNKTIFDILPNRNKSYLIQYFKSFKNRANVKYFVMDMTNNYKSLSFLFPNSQVVTDRFHYVQQVYWALDNVRKRLQEDFIKHKFIFQTQ